MKFTSNITVEYVDGHGSDLGIAKAARVSTIGVEAAEAIGINSTSGLINYLMKNKHGSPFEHNSMTFRVHAPIFVFREWMRHRIGWSYNEESGRYKQLDPVFYIPPSHRPLRQAGKPGHYNYIPGEDGQHEDLADLLNDSYTMSYSHYETLLSDGIAREVARMVLPVGIFSSMYVTCNARSLMAFLSLRTEDNRATFPSHPQWEIARAAEQMEFVFAERFPLTCHMYNLNGRVAP